MAHEIGHTEISANLFGYKFSREGSDEAEINAVRYAVTLARGIVVDELGGETFTRLSQYIAQNEADILDGILKNILVAPAYKNISDITSKSWQVFSVLDAANNSSQGFLKPNQAVAGCDFVAGQCSIIIGK